MESPTANLHIRIRTVNANSAIGAAENDRRLKALINGFAALGLPSDCIIEKRRKTPGFSHGDIRRMAKLI